jgi:hypothetical protein
MERAVAGLSAADEHERVEAERLQERLRAARRTKQEIESAVRRNVELTAEYANLEDDPTSTFAERQHALEARRDCLLFLGLHVPAERIALYRQDLRSVETQIALERTAEAERQLDATDDPGERLRLVRQTLDDLTNATTQSEHGLEPPGRVVRLIEHWRTLAAQCQGAVDALQRERDRHDRQRRRMLTIAAVAVVATGAAIVFAVRVWWLGS